MGFRSIFPVLLQKLRDFWRRSTLVNVVKPKTVSDRKVSTAVDATFEAGSAGPTDRVFESACSGLHTVIYIRKL